jgi:hypothetical protein
MLRNPRFWKNYAKGLGILILAFGGAALAGAVLVGVAYLLMQAYETWGAGIFCVGFFLLFIGVKAYFITKYEEEADAGE